MLGMATHYFMLLIPTVQFVFFLLYFKRLHRYFRPWLVSQIMAGAILLPWWAFIMAQKQKTTGIGWIPTPTMMDPLYTLWNFTIGYQEHPGPAIMAATAIVGAALISGIVLAARQPVRGMLLLLWAFLPLLLVWGLSQGHISFYIDRYFLVLTPAILLLAALGLTALPGRWRQVGIILVLLAAGLGTAHTFLNAPAFTKDNWRELARILRTELKPGDALVTCANGYRLALDFYLPGPVAASLPWLYHYPTAFNFNQELTGAQRLWIINPNPRRTAHHLGYSFDPTLNPATLPPAQAAWVTENRPRQVKVAGLTAFEYPLSNPPDLNKIVQWQCQE